MTLTNSIKSIPGFSLLAVLCLVILYAPLLVVMVYSFNDSLSITIWGGFSLRWYEQVFFGLEAEKFQKAAWNSISIAFMAAITATSIAFSAAIGVVRTSPFKGKNLNISLLSLPIMVPEIVTAVATLIFFSMISFRLGYTSILVAHIVFCIPFAYLPISARMQSIEKVYEEAALDLYADRKQIFLSILLPLMVPGIISGFLLAFIISLDDFIITSFVKGAGVETLPTAIFGSIKQGIKPDIMALSTLLLLVSTFLVTISYFLSRADLKNKLN